MAVIVHQPLFLSIKIFFSLSLYLFFIESSSWHGESYVTTTMELMEYDIDRS